MLIVQDPATKPSMDSSLFQPCSRVSDTEPAGYTPGVDWEAPEVSYGKLHASKVYHGLLALVIKGTPMRPRRFTHVRVWARHYAWL
jgi:hypothetical protein